MGDEESNEHLKIFKCLVDTGADVLRSAVERKLFNNNAITFKQYLHNAKHQFYHQFEKNRSKPCCSGNPHNCYVNGNMDKKIFNKVYNKTATSDTHHCLDRFEVKAGITTDDLDLSDLNFFLYNSNTLSQQETNTLQTIMSIRSSICHPDSSHCYSIDELQNIWLSLEQAVFFFAEPYRYRKLVTMHIKTLRSCKVHEIDSQKIINEMRTESEKILNELQMETQTQTDIITKSVKEETVELKNCIIDENDQTQSNFKKLTGLFIMIIDTSKYIWIE
ncbi:unnamed protein product [Mytilus coruscus]|uniref:DZIP3-like HEPN domain-containing protein n=1 Tax=Mytilus coruscus TaxID=42192 RepID=A0A6J8DJI6_MYTCO|nr:unnamed protein product [Mytilus coruscus]